MQWHLSQYISTMDTLSPPKVQKGAAKLKKDRLAYKTFAVQSTNINRMPEMEEAVVEGMNSTHCGVCKMPFFNQTKRKECGHCKNIVCLDHLRKKRKIDNSWRRICDDCEDRILFENYMKLEIKAEQSLVAHEQIVKLRNEQSRTQMDARNKEHLAGELAEAQRKYNMAMTDLNGKEENLARESQVIEGQHQQLDAMQQTLPRALQDDHEALKIQDQKITKELVKLEKRANQLMQLMSKAEQEVTKAYEAWERKQSQGKQKKKQDCLLF